MGTVHGTNHSTARARNRSATRCRAAPRTGRLRRQCQHHPPHCRTPTGNHRLSHRAEPSQYARGGAQGQMMTAFSAEHMTAFSTDRLWLAPLGTDLRVMSQLVEWLNDPEVVRYSEQRHRVHTIRSQYEYADSFRFPSLYRLIMLKTNNHMIGSITAHVDASNNIADIGILIGDKRIW